ncbi:hypothetical protein DE146DRAFT_666645 [Phaeosphaeria sp. MPI-PUGE-AT-0046c]|nr:hypothetical protein DE146DRAFT_666645 [Phaeosphaeria sp. MPI-PUGE-AT-0046c]
MDGNCLSSIMAGGVLRAGRSKTCRIDGLRKQSMAWGLGRMEVASAEAVIGIRIEKRVALLEVVRISGGVLYNGRTHSQATGQRMRARKGNSSKSVVVLKNDGKE